VEDFPQKRLPWHSFSALSANQGPLTSGCAAMKAWRRSPRCKRPLFRIRSWHTIIGGGHATAVVGIAESRTGAADKSRPRLVASRCAFEVIAGRVERDGRPGRRFVCAMQRRSLARVLVAAVLAQSGMTRTTKVDVVNDGARGMRSLVEDVAPRLAPRIIDWFHIGLKLQAVRTPIAARKGIWTPLPRVIVRAERLAQKVRDALWRGQGEEAIAMLDTLHASLAEAAADARIDKFFQGCARTAQRAAKQLLDFLRNNRDDLIDYQRARMEGRRISTASAESVMNHLVNRRMSKRQQMRWDFASAHRMLMVRVDLLDGCLEDSFRGRYPGFRSLEVSRHSRASP